MSVNQLKAGAILSYVSIALTNIIALLYTPYMLRMLGKSEFGLYSLAASIVAYLTVLDLGFGNAIIRYTSKFRAEGKLEEQYKMFGMFFILYTIISILSVVVGSILLLNIDSLFSISMTIEETSKLEVMMILMIFNLAFTFPMSVWGAIITAYEDFIFQRLVNIVRIILNPIVMIVMLEMGYRAIGMVVVTTIFNFLTLSINCWYCLFKLKIKVRFGKFDFGFLREVTIYSLWIFLTAIVDRIYWSSGQFVLGVLKGSAAVAVYAIAIQMEQIYMSFSTAISGVFLPRVTGLIVKKHNEKEISDIFIRIGRIQYAITIYILVGFIIFGLPFIRFWAGQTYEDAYWITLCIFIPLTVPIIQSMGVVILQAKNQMKFRSLLYLFISIFGLIVSIPMTKLYGTIGCAIGITFSLILGQIVCMNIYYYKKIKIDIPRFWSEIFKMTYLPLLFCILFLLFFKYYSIESILELVIGIIVFSFMYLPLSWFFQLNKSEQILISSPIRSLISKFKK